MSNIDTGNLIGTSGTDSITLTGAQLDAILIGSGTINLGSGTGDTINLTSTSSDLNTLGATDASIQGVEAISAATAGAGVTITLSGQTEAFSITGSANADTITGGTGGDTIVAGSGNDTIAAGGGNDTINLANGDFASGKSIDGGANSDTIVLTNGTTVDFSARHGDERRDPDRQHQQRHRHSVGIAAGRPRDRQPRQRHGHAERRGQRGHLAACACHDEQHRYRQPHRHLGHRLDHPHRRPAQCDPDRLGHHQSRFRHRRHDQPDVDVVRPQHSGRLELIDPGGGGDLRGGGRSWRHDHAVGSDRGLLDHRQRQRRYHHRRRGRRHDRGGGRQRHDQPGQRRLRRGRVDRWRCQQRHHRPYQWHDGGLLRSAR